MKCREDMEIFSCLQQIGKIPFWINEGCYFFNLQRKEKYVSWLVRERFSSFSFPTITARLKGELLFIELLNLSYIDEVGIPVML